MSDTPFTTPLDDRASPSAGLGASPEAEARLQKEARRRVRRKVGFYTHAMVYVLVNLGLLGVNAWTGGRFWAGWPMAGWGLGLAIHGLATVADLRGNGIRERMHQAEVERLRQRR